MQIIFGSPRGNLKISTINTLMPIDLETYRELEESHLEGSRAVAASLVVRIEESGVFRKTLRRFVRDSHTSDVPITVTDSPAVPAVAR